jgi:hypothetical protein
VNIKQFGPVGRKYLISDWLGNLVQRRECSPMRSWRAWSTFNNDDVVPFHGRGRQWATLNVLPDRCAESTTRCHLRHERHRRGAIVDGDERGVSSPNPRGSSSPQSEEASAGEWTTTMAATASNQSTQLATRWSGLRVVAARGSGCRELG